MASKKVPAVKKSVKTVKPAAPKVAKYNKGSGVGSKPPVGRSAGSTKSK